MQNNVCNGYHLSNDYKNYLCASDKWSAIDCPIFAPACNDLGLALPMLAKATWVLGYPIGIILDNGQALACDDLSNLFPKLTVSVLFPVSVIHKSICYLKSF